MTNIDRPLLSDSAVPTLLGFFVIGVDNISPHAKNAHILRLFVHYN